MMIKRPFALILALLLIAPQLAHARRSSIAISENRYALQNVRSSSLRRRVELRRQIRMQRLTPSVRRVQRQFIPAAYDPRRYVRGYREIEVLDVYNAAIILARLPDGSIREVRLLGINGPEILPPPASPECFAVESRDALKWYLLSGKSISLQEEEGYHYDSYNRLVRYINRDGRDVGLWLIENGFAWVDRDYDFDKRDLYEEEELEARTSGIERTGLGLWFGWCDWDDNPDLRMNR